MRWLPILMYHRVVEEVPAEDPYHICMPLSAFREQLSLLRRLGYHAVALDDAVQAMLNNMSLPRRAFVITFDDGYVDTLEMAAPVLREMGFPATVFMVAGLVGAENRWDAGKAAAAPLMTWEQLAEWRGAGFTVGSHTVSHADLARVPLSEAQRELVESRERLEQGLGAPVRSFAYPYGHWTPEAKDAVAEAGYDYACNATWHQHERYALARIDARYSRTPLEIIVPMQAPFDQMRRGLRRAIRRGR